MKKPFSVITLLALVIALASLMPAMASTDSIEMPVPEDGETLYIGTAETDEAASLTVAFLLSADGDAIREVTLFMEDVRLNVRQGSTTTRLQITSAQARYPRSYPLDEDNVIDGDTFVLRDVVIEEGRITATLAYTYTYYAGGIGQAGSQTKVPFAPVEIVFEKQD